MLIVLFIITTVCLWVVHKLLAYRKFVSQLDVVPQFKGLPIIGLAHKLVDHTQSVRIGYELFRKCGTSHTLYIGPEPHLIICDPELAEIILSSNSLIDKHHSYELMHSWFGTGLLTSTGDKWRNHRKVLTPSFHYSILEQFVLTFDKASKVLVQQLAKEVEAKNESVDIFKYITLCTLDIICETAMGTEVNAQTNSNLDFVQSIKDMAYIIFIRTMSALHFTWIFRLSKYYKKEVNALKVLRAFSGNIIAQRRQALESKAPVANVDELGAKAKHTFLDVLLQATVNNRKLTDAEIREEVDTFMFEKKVYEEVISVIGKDKNKSITMDDLNQLKYTEMVIKESLRLYPSVLAYGRTLKHDVPYKNGVIPQGTQVVVNAYNLHRNATTFPDPEKFDPERFTVENSAKRHPYGYLPFSAGPRNCIGQKFAMLELKSTISKMVRFYEIIPAVPHHEIKVITTVTMHSSNGFLIGLKHRES